MGLYLNWLAVEGVDQAVLLERLGFRACGWGADELNSAYACVTLPTGWTVVVSSDGALDLDRLLPEASIGGAALGGEASGHVMFSRVRSFRDREPVWAVTHDSERGPDDLEVVGEPPSELAAIRERQSRAAAEGDEQVDYMFEAPMDLANHLCGYPVIGRPILEWTIVQPAAQRPPAAGPRTRTLRDAIASELMPLMRSWGWDPEVGRPDWHVGRIQDGRAQALWLRWKDDGREIYFDPEFAAWAGPTRDGRPVVLGDIRPVRPPFRVRLAARLRAFGRQQTTDERVEQVVGRARRELLALDRLLTSGEAEPGVRVRYGSLDAWRELLAKG